MCSNDDLNLEYFLNYLFRHHHGLLLSGLMYRPELHQGAANRSSWCQLGSIISDGSSLWFNLYPGHPSLGRHPPMWKPCTLKYTFTHNDHCVHTELPTQPVASFTLGATVGGSLDCVCMLYLKTKAMIFIMGLV